MTFYSTPQVIDVRVRGTGHLFLPRQNQDFFAKNPAGTLNPYAENPAQNPNSCAENPALVQNLEERILRRIQNLVQRTLL